MLVLEDAVHVPSLRGPQRGGRNTRRPAPWRLTHVAERSAVNFNSLEFLIVFLPVTFFSFYAVPMQLRLWVLVVASLVFYGVSGLEVLLAFLVFHELGKICCIHWTSCDRALACNNLSSL